MEKKKTNKILLIISGVLTAAICGVMNFVLIPKIEAGADGIRCFDMNFAYSPAEALEFLAKISESAKDFYLHYQLPLDFIYPIVYCLFFALLFITLSGKKTKLVILPVILAVFDYAENIFTIYYLKDQEVSEKLFYISSAITSIKTILMYICFLIIIILLIKKVKDKKKNPAVS